MRGGAAGTVAFGLDRPPDHLTQVLMRHGLGEKIRRSSFHRSDHVQSGRCAGEHDYRQLAIQASNFAQSVQAIPIQHHYVEQHGRYFGSARSQASQYLVPVSSRFHGITHALQSGLEIAQNLRLIFPHQNRALCGQTPT